MTAPALSPTERAIVDRFESADDDLDHLYCGDCNPDAASALCGADLTLATESDVLDFVCVVCRDLDRTHDDYCGGC